MKEPTSILRHIRSHKEIIITSSFHFVQVPPHLWAEELVKLPKDQELTIPLFWGAHETMRGTRDFSKTSRLRLEKFLQLCAERELKVHMQLGFPVNESEILPEWTHSIEQGSLIPEALWDEYVTGYSARQFPSLFHPQLREGFYGFLDELSTILCLYAHPEGPVTRVSLDPGVFCYDWNSGTKESFARWLASRFESLQAMNFLFQTNFLSFEAATQKQGLRTLTDKRPWLMAREYKQFRQSLLNDWIRNQREKILEKHSILQPLFKHNAGAVANDAQIADAKILIEDSFFDTTPAGEPVPLCPWGNFFPTSVQAFRLSEYLLQKLRISQFSVSSLSQLDSSAAPTEKLQIIVAGKYLVKEAQAAIVKRLDQGESFYFPFGLPQYDERMTALPWGFEKSSATVKTDTNHYTLWRRGAGTVLVPIALPQPGEEWFGSLKASTQELEVSL